MRASESIGLVPKLCLGTQVRQTLFGILWRETEFPDSPFPNRVWERGKVKSVFLCKRRGFTLVELLVVIGVLAVILGLLIPAIQHFREAANISQCANNLHQIGVGLQSSHDVNRHFPSGGWGWSWVGMPDRGSGPAQPGGWLYSVLPYVEQEKLRNLGRGEDSPQIEESMVSLLETPVALFNCPSRRSGGPYPVLPTHGTFRVGIASTGRTTTVDATVLARTDYAANAGSQAFNELSAGPLTLAAGDDPDYDWPSTALCSGIFFQRSAVSLGQITRGSSNTVLIGERYLNPLHYSDGVDQGDNESMYAGFDNDVYRVTFLPPQQDRAGYTNARIFGSAHGGGLNMLYCDGAVRWVTYEIDPDVFRDSGRRSE